MKYEIRELSVGGILDQSIRLIQDNFMSMFGLVLILQVPFSLLQGFISLALTPVDPVNPAQEVSAAYYRAHLIAQIVDALCDLFVIFFLLPIANAALVHVVARAYLQQPTSITQALKFAGQRLVAFIWTNLLMMAAILGGTLLCFVPGILATVWFGLATEVAILEGPSGFEALTRSRQLMLGNINKMLGLCFIFVTISLTGAVAVLFVPQPHLRVVLGAFAEGATSMFASAVFVVFYFSTRCQHENFDLTLLAESVAAGEASVVADPELTSDWVG